MIFCPFGHIDAHESTWSNDAQRGERSVCSMALCRASSLILVILHLQSQDQQNQHVESCSHCSSAYPCNLLFCANTHQCFSRTCCFHLQCKKYFYPEDESTRFFWNTGTCLKQYGVTSQTIIISSYTCLICKISHWALGHQKLHSGHLLSYMYEGWTFNSGNYLFTTDTK